MIRTRDLKKVYTTEEVETTALNNINIEVKEGEFVSIMGPSGCGKSTLLNILGLLDNPSDGDYLFLDENVGGFSERKRASFRKGNIGFVFQSFNLIDELTVYENIELPLLLNEKVNFASPVFLTSKLLVSVCGGVNPPKSRLDFETSISWVTTLASRLIFKGELSLGAL